jgi:hypothetical protein
MGITGARNPMDSQMHSVLLYKEGVENWGSQGKRHGFGKVDVTVTV